MKSIRFPQANVDFAKDQNEYNTLPAHKTEMGTVVSCWSLSWRERLKILFGGKLWLSMMTFNTPLQPVLMLVEREGDSDKVLSIVRDCEKVL